MRVKIIKPVVFLLIFVLLFCVVQDVLTPDHNQNQNVWYSVNGFDHLEKDSLEIVFLGSSTVLLGVSPMKIYEDTGICSYNLATPGQPIGLSCEMLKWALSTQDPSVVVLNVAGLFGKTEDSTGATWRYVMDNLSLSGNKLRMAKDYGKLPKGDGFWSVLFPIIKFHDRWKEISRDDFVQRSVGQYYLAGEYISPFTVRGGTELGMANAIAQEMKRINSATILYDDGDGTKTKQTTTPLWQPELVEEDVDILREMQKLCEQAGTELVLTMIPTLSNPITSSTAWTKDKYDLVRETANDLGLQYVDMLYDADNVVDFATDTYDAGFHLNFYGAEKVTAFLEDYLTENYDLEPNRNGTWDGMLEDFRGIREVAYLELETDFDAYLSKLVENKDKYSILIAASSDYTTCLTEENYDLLDQLGLKLIREGKLVDSYIAVIQPEKVAYEAVSSRRLTYSGKLSHDNSVYIISSGWYSAPNATININNEPYACGGTGLNIVVLDEDTGVVIDSICVKSQEPGVPVSHRGADAYAYIHRYESLAFLDGTHV